MEAALIDQMVGQACCIVGFPVNNLYVCGKLKPRWEREKKSNRVRIIPFFLIFM